MVYMFLANGFEEVEAITVIDVLRRANVDIKTVGIGSKTIVGAHNISVLADLNESEMRIEDMELVILPGGWDGVQNMSASETVKEVLDYAYESKTYIGAICAAPIILGKAEMLKGKKALCYPSLEENLIGAEIETVKTVVKDDFIITSKGPATAFDFGLELVKLLKGEETYKQVKADCLYNG